MEGEEEKERKKEGTRDGGKREREGGQQTRVEKNRDSQSQTEKHRQPRKVAVSSITSGNGGYSGQ